MIGRTHGFEITPESCRGCLSCMRVCPTHAIRVREGKARYAPDHCIDCGECLHACPHGAIAATTWSIGDLSRFRLKVAVPSPVLYGQFPAGITPSHVVSGLLMLGFDAVWDYGVEVCLIQRAIRQYVDNWKGPFPLISISCPVVVRLVQVSYPRMVDQLASVQLPREIAGREIKRHYSRELGLPDSEIAAIYITPCQAKTISVLEPAEGAKSFLDGTLGISDVYNAVVASAKAPGVEVDRKPALSPVRNSTFLRWSLGDGLSQVLTRERYLHVTGVSNITQVFDDIESGRLRNVEFVEAHSCWSGCPGGNLTVANLYVTLSKLHALIRHLPEMDPVTQAQVDRRYQEEDFALERPIRPRPVRGSSGSLRERVQRVQEAEAILTKLPGFDCGLCGAPGCKDLARDITIGDARRADCVFHSRERLRQLQKAPPGARDGRTKPRS